MLRRVLVLAIAAVAVATGASAAVGASPSVIRVTLTAQNHHPRASHDPAVQWGYCVKVRTADGRSVPSTIHLQFVLRRKVLRPAGLITLGKGYDHWCGTIGGEVSLFNVLPKRVLLDFQAVVTAQGVTVKRNWPIIVR
jgi:hypothetical protein